MASLTYDLAPAGLSVGAAAALSGIGLIVTCRATGVLNFAHGAIAMLCAYLLRQFAVVWSWPLWAGAAVVLLAVAPGLGLALERGVFRPLATAGGDPARTLVASIGVFVLLVGAAALLWGTGAREDAPTLIAADPWGQLAVVCAIAVAVWAVTRWTRFGGELRAVVDNRPLAVLGGIDADRVAAGRAFGAFTAGLTGALLAPFVRLDPYGLPLLVMVVVAVAVAARMRYLSVPVALAIGVAQSGLTRLHPGGWAEPLLRAVGGESLRGRTARRCARPAGDRRARGAAAGGEARAAGCVAGGGGAVPAAAGLRGPGSSYVDPGAGAGLDPAVVELARALAGRPHVLLLDEPAAGLDGTEVAAPARLLRALAADGTALLVVEHDLDLVADLADTVHLMAAGRIVASGPPGTVLDRTAGSNP
ncbi:hypothetical protein [Streptomyces sp. NPDC050264]|uniref:ABC transporter permease subunit n=1 Tax=Streptomyces sp. NPDC050264 TaxID=3155038 RepID=UPI0034479758